MKNLRKKLICSCIASTIFFATAPITFAANSSKISDIKPNSYNGTSVNTTSSNIKMSVLSTSPDYWANHMPVLSYGDVNQYVGGLQGALNLWRSGIAGNCDNIFGSRTLNAVKTFQSAHGLNNDGIVGPYTWAALDGYYHGAVENP